MVKTAAVLEREIKSYLRKPVSAHGAFLVELSDHGRPSLKLKRDDYRTALRDAKDELLGSGGDLSKIYLRGTLVSEGRLQRRIVRGGGQKFSVVFVGEKPVKRQR